MTNVLISGAGPVGLTLANELVERARALNPGVRVTVTDVLTKVCAMALQRHRDVNVQFTSDALLRYRYRPGPVGSASGQPERTQRRDEIGDLHERLAQTHAP